MLPFLCILGTIATNKKQKIEEDTVGGGGKSGGENAGSHGMQDNELASRGSHVENGAFASRDTPISSSLPSPAQTSSPGAIPSQFSSSGSQPSPSSSSVAGPSHPLPPSLPPLPADLTPGSLNGLLVALGELAIRGQHAQAISIVNGLPSNHLADLVIACLANLPPMRPPPSPTVGIMGAQPEKPLSLTSLLFGDVQPQGPTLLPQPPQPPPIAPAVGVAPKLQVSFWIGFGHSVVCVRP